MTKRMTIILASAVGMLLLWAVLVYLPATKRQAELKQQIATRQAELDDYISTMQQIPTIIQARQATLERLREASSKLYTKHDLVQLFDDLRSAASAHRLRLVDITPPVAELLQLNRATPEIGEPQFLTLTMQLDGNYLDFGQFVESLLQEPYFRSVQSCVITNTQDGSGRITHLLGIKALLGMSREAS